MRKSRQVLNLSLLLYLVMMALLPLALAWDGGNFFNGSFIDSSPDNQLKSKVWTRNNVNLKDKGEIYGLDSLQVKFQAELGSNWAYSQSQPLIADIDNDGVIEIVVVDFKGDTTHSYIHCFNGENGTLEWTSADQRYMSYRRLTAFDIDLDGTFEILGSTATAGAYQGVHCFNHTGGEEWVENSDLAYEVACFDIDDDSEIEVIYAGDTALYCLNSTGSIEWTCPIPVAVSVSIGDLDNDGSYEIVTQQYSASVPNYVIVVNGTGDITLNQSVPTSNIYIVGLNDVDGDNDMEILYYNRFTSTTQNIGLLHHDGTLAWNISTGYALDIWDAAMYDVDADGYSEIFLAGKTSPSGEILSLKGQDGSTRWNYTTTYQAESGVVLADINSDNALEALFTDRTGDLSCFNANTGALLWQYENGGIIRFNVAVADVDGDGLGEIVFGSGDESGSNWLRLTVLDEYEYVPPSNASVWIGVASPYAYAAISLMSLALIIGVGATLIAVFQEQNPALLIPVVIVAIGVLIALFIALPLLNAFSGL